MAKYDIVLITHGQEALTLNCIESIYRAGGDYRLIWVDNGSEDMSRSVVHEAINGWDIPYTGVFLDNNEGFVRGANVGIVLSKAKNVVLLNNDTVVPLNWLESLGSYCEQPGYGLVGAVEDPTGYPGGIVSIEKLREAYEVPQVFFRDVAMIPFFCVMIARRTIEAVGLLNTLYDPGHCDDDDYCRRVKRAGLKIGTDLNTIVKHVGRATWKALMTNVELNELIERNRGRLFSDSARHTVTLFGGQTITEEEIAEYESKMDFSDFKQRKRLAEMKAQYARENTEVAGP